MRLLIALLCLLCAGCSNLRYYGQALGGQLDLMLRREDAARLAAAPGTPHALKSQLDSALALRHYAIETLSLPDNGSYRHYSALDRRYAVWSVVATPEFSIEPLLWCYPVIGCARYRGYFRESGARDLAAQLAAQGHDVMVGGVPAYSTLGRFADPLTDAMFEGGDERLALLLFHELAHQVVYAHSDSAFNEAFAVVVARAGLERWLAERGDAASLAQVRARFAAEDQAQTLVSAALHDLAALYESAAPDPELRRSKAGRLAELSWQGRKLGPVAHWFTPPLNHARLIARATYYQQVPALTRLYEACGARLARFYAAARALGRLTPEQRKAALDQSAQVCPDA
jgi:predicted aminopeptidase